MAKNGGDFWEILGVAITGIAILGVVSAKTDILQNAEQTYNKVEVVASSAREKILDAFSGDFNFFDQDSNLKEVDASDTELVKQATAWTFNDSPNYYKVIGKSGIDPSVFPKKGQITYGELDSLGRTTTARGSLTYINVEGSYGKRGQFTDSSEGNPSGWVGNKTYKDSDGKTKIVRYRIDWLNQEYYLGAFWNKSHLIADSLGGEAIRRNAVTAPRTQNVGSPKNDGGMRYTEKKAQEWLESHQNGVLYYEPKPVYSGNELIPRAVVVSMLSSDKSIDEKVIVYNTANGYTIDYNTGQFSKN